MIIKTYPHRIRKICFLHGDRKIAMAKKIL